MSPSLQHWSVTRSPYTVVEMSTYQTISFTSWPHWEKCSSTSLTSSGVGVTLSQLSCRQWRPPPQRYCGDVSITQDKASKPFNSTKHLTLPLQIITKGSMCNYKPKVYFYQFAQDTRGMSFQWEREYPLTFNRLAFRWITLVKPLKIADMGGKKS